MTQVYPVVPADIYCGRVVNNHARHFKDIDRNVFAPFIVGKCGSCDNLDWVF